MIAITGVFTVHENSDLAYRKLLEIGLPPERLSVLRPNASEQQIEAAPTMDTEQPGPGRALGGVVGGAFGGAGGLGVGSAIASMFVPGVGQVLATGVFGALLLGGVGAAVGAKAGKSAEQFLGEGVPKDELFVYRDALKQGRTVMIVLAENEEQAGGVRRVLAESGAESIDLAREKWDVGMRDATEEQYP